MALLVLATTVHRTWLAVFPQLFDPWSMLPFGFLVLVVLVDVRHPLRLAHLDLLAMLSLVLGMAYGGAARPWATLLIYPQLGYLALRMIALARTRRAPAALRSQIPRNWLALGLLVLIGVHIAWEVPPATYMDIASDSVRGALRIVHGQSLYAGAAGTATYGPTNFLAYVPFATAISSGAVASRLATICFTMITAALLFVLGRRERGVDTGLLLAYLWLALPFTLYEDATGLNDSLVAACLVATLLCLRRPARLGAAAAVSGFTKLAPLAIVPLLAMRRGRRDFATFSLAFALTTAVLFVPALDHSSISAFVSQSFGYQSTRVAENSIWAALSLSWSHHAHWLIVLSGVLQALTLGTAVAAALMLPRLHLRDDLAGTAAASAGIVLLLELSLSSFAYSYILWFAPLVLVALVLGAAGDASRANDAAAVATDRRRGSGRRSEPITA
ncbi:MAG TPA: glycosyltransferase 87 family protein [Solirubrobacteraceae bacterium]